MPHQKESLEDLVKRIELREREEGSAKQGKLASLSPDDAAAQKELDHLAQLLLRVFLSQQCEKTSHQSKVCEDCRAKRPSASGF